MSERILIVEDEAAIQSILFELLTDAGYKVEVVSDGLDSRRCKDVYNLADSERRRQAGR